MAAESRRMTADLTREGLAVYGCEALSITDIWECIGSKFVDAWLRALPAGKMPTQMEVIKKSRAMRTMPSLSFTTLPAHPIKSLLQKRGRILMTLLSISHRKTQM